MARISLDKFMREDLELNKQILNELKLINIEIKNFNKNLVMVNNELMRLK
jgi:hypothetical protein